MMKTYTLLAICTLLSLSSRAQFSQPGELDTTFNFGKPHSFFTNPANPHPGEGASDLVYALARQPNGKVIIVGAFGFYNGSNRIGIARINIDGSLDTSFNPGTGSNNLVLAVALQSDGKVLIGGYFTFFNGQFLPRICRLNEDGSIDNSFNPGTGANSPIFSLAPQPDGKVLIGGEFTSFNGVARNRIARLNSDGSLDTSFNPGTGASGKVQLLAVQPNGKILMGGDFISYSGFNRNRIARINTNGSLDTTFNPGMGANSIVRSYALQSDGKMLIGGDFTSFNGVIRRHLVRLNSNGTLDTTLNTGNGLTGVPNPGIHTIALQSNGKVLIGGAFSNYNGSARNFIARLNSDGSLDPNFNSGNGINFTVLSTVLQPDEKVLVAGWFHINNGSTSNHTTRLNADGSLDFSFNPHTTGANAAIFSISSQSDGKIIVSGSFSNYSGLNRNSITRILTDGRTDTSFNPGTGANWWIYSHAIQPDGKILIGGKFTEYNGIALNMIARLNSHGSLDTTFNPGSGANGWIEPLLLQNDGKILIGGWFTSYNGIARNHIARLNADGSLDATFNVGLGASNLVRAIAVQPDGKVIVAGDFINFNGLSLKRIVRLNSDGSIDTTFNPGSGANAYIWKVVIQPNGKILIAGSFTQYDNIGRNGVARLNANGSLDTSFNPGTGANSDFLSLILQPDGKVLIGGNFTQYNNIGRSRIARLNADGSLDTGFNIGTGANSWVYSLSLQPDGTVLIGGQFTFYNGIHRPRIARIFSTGIVTGITEVNSDWNSDFAAFPVPFNYELTIKAELPFRYEIVDLMGRVQLSGISETQEAKCFTGNLAKGIYLVKITYNDQTYLRKVVKE